VGAKKSLSLFIFFFSSPMIDFGESEILDESTPQKRAAHSGTTTHHHNTPITSPFFYFRGKRRRPPEKNSLAAGKNCGRLRTLDSTHFVSRSPLPVFLFFFGPIFLTALSSFPTSFPASGY
jgi:hypothetical protein